MNRKLWSAIGIVGIGLLMGLLINWVTEAYWEAVKPYKGWLLAALVVVVIASIWITYHQMDEDDKTQPNEGVHVSDRSTNSTLENSPIEVSADSNATVKREAEDSTIKNSGIKIS
jgi:hypothetical protein